MVRNELARFREIWAVDFEFHAPPGCRPKPLCLVAHELISGDQIWLWGEDSFGPRPPYPTDNGVLFISFLASAEIGCHLALGWPIPDNIIDPYVEFKNLTNGRYRPYGAGLLGVATQLALRHADKVTKDEGRELAIKGGPYSPEERATLLTYNATDTSALAEIFRTIEPDINTPYALLRGRYMAAVAKMEAWGIPIDTALLKRLRKHWTAIELALIAEVDRDYGVYDGTTFKLDRFERYLLDSDIPWLATDTGRLATDDETFKEMAKTFPQLTPLRTLRHTLGELRLEDISVGQDGRSRALLWPFQSKTGRNQPSNSKYIFGPSAWIRGLIKPKKGWAVAYLDWEQQEFGEAAALSGDPGMMAAYRSGDPYLALAKQVGAVPSDATKQTHPEIRDLYKQVILGVQYGMTARGLARRLDITIAEAEHLLAQHRKAYPIFWAWSDRVVDRALLSSELNTVFDWRMRITPTGDNAKNVNAKQRQLYALNDRTFRNFPMQANGAEMLRIACCLATERGVRVIAPVHDAIMIEAPVDKVEEAVGIAKRAMREAANIVLNGRLELQVEAHVVRYPDRYESEKGAAMWRQVMATLERAESAAGKRKKSSVG